MPLAPYVSGDGLLTATAVGIIPLLQRNRWAGLALVLLADLPFFMPKAVLYFYQSYYWTLLLLIVWILAGYAGTARSAPAQSLSASEKPPTASDPPAER